MMKRLFLSLILSSLFGISPAQAFNDETAMEDAPMIEVIMWIAISTNMVMRRVGIGQKPARIITRP